MSDEENDEVEEKTESAAGSGFGEIDVNKVQVNSKVKKLDKKYGKVQTVEVKKRDPFIPPPIEKKLRETLPKARAITAAELATKNDIRVSTVKKLLNDMVKEGLLEVCSGSRRVRIYRGKSAK